MHLTIQPLLAGERGLIEAHLLRLAPEDRSLRFAAGLVTDDTVRRYVASIRFGHDLTIGLVDAACQVVGFAHGAVFERQGRRHVEAAFSVDAPLRGLGFGARLMHALLLRVAGEGGATVVGSCAARNLPMRRLFERAEMALVREDDELSAHRQVAPRVVIPAPPATAAWPCPRRDAPFAPTGP